LIAMKKVTYHRSSTRLAVSTTGFLTMKRCPICNKQFLDDANFCPSDAGRLVPDVSEPARGGNGAGASSSAVGGRFQLSRKLGGGRTGEVFEAVDAAGGPPVAVKLVSAQVFPTPLLLQRTERELKQLEKVAAPEVARVIAHGKQGERLWIASELAPGQSLDQVVAAGGRLQGPQAVAVAQAIGRGLADAARAGVIHRDLSPKNVLIGPGGAVKLINFGCPVPYSDRVQGVVEFVSPEEAEGKPVDQRANLYSLGAVLYFCLTGRPPHTGPGEEVLRARLVTDPPRPSTLAPVSEPLEAIVMKALERSSSKRFMTINQMVEALGSLGEAAQPTMAGVAPAQSGGGKAPAPARTMMGLGSVHPPEAFAGHGAVRPSAAEAAPPVAPPAFVTQQAQQAAAAMQAAAMQAAAAGPAVSAPAGGKSGGKRKAPEAVPSGPSKGKFRETMWFKKGELDEAAAQAAAAEIAASPGTLGIDRADSLPIEDRYQDDGTLSTRDRDKFSLRTGSTTMIDAVKPPGAKSVAGKVSEKELVGELRSGRGLILAALAVGLLLIAIILYFVVT
jgi:hypothetical protein